MLRTSLPSRASHAHPSCPSPAGLDKCVKCPPKTAFEQTTGECGCSHGFRGKASKKLNSTVEYVDDECLCDGGRLDDNGGQGNGG